MKKPDVTLILPCYNEDEHLESSVKRIFKVLLKATFTSEVIFIDDKSTDNTRKMLKLIKKAYNRYNVRIFYHSHNKGRGATVSEGIMKSKGEIVGYIDIDCEVSPTYIPQFVKAIQSGYDLSVAERVYRISTSTIPRWMLSKVYRKMVNFLFNLNLDTEAGYKFFKRKKILPLLYKIKSNHWFWDSEIIIYSYLSGLKIQSIKVVFTRRGDKTSTVRLIPDTVDYFKNLYRLKKKLGTKI